MADSVDPTVVGTRQSRRDDVLDAAIEVFHDKGYAAASIQDVAERVGVLKGSLYYYIDSKEDLLSHVFDTSDEQSRAIMEGVTEMDAPALEKLRSFVYEWSLWHLSNLERASVYFREWRHLDGRQQGAVRRKRREYEGFLIDLLEATKAEGQAAAGLDPRYVCFFTLSALNGLPSWYRDQGGDSAEYIAGAYAEMVVGMVRGTAAASRGRVRG
ncbi:MAG: TetR family transcriptional regulator [Actinobacteria bacterium]|nr:TetR family transcriptional regulator [Actinomycetota bacterium]